MVCVLLPHRIAKEFVINCMILVPEVMPEFNIMVLKRWDNLFCKVECRVALGPSVGALKFICFLSTVSSEW